MADRTGIAWTDSTFNPWMGCQKVSPGCDRCYAETLVADRHHWTQWGPEGVRVRTSPGYWRKPLGWNRAAEASGKPRRVFCASLADVFDNQSPPGAREDLWELIRRTPALTWQILTKRPQNMARMLPEGWPEGFGHVWLGASAENQEEYDRRWPVLASVPAAVRFISYEPALGPLSILEHPERPDWLIWGGESGPGCRPMDPDWARQIVLECLLAQVPIFAKQWGDYRHNPLVTERGMSVREARESDRFGKGGAVLDNRIWREFPKERRQTCQSG